MGDLFRLTTPTISVQVIDGESVAAIIPPGAVVRVCGEALADSRMVQVAWENKLLLMFKMDLRERGEEVQLAQGD